MFTKEELLREVWGYGRSAVPARRVARLRVRKKLCVDPSDRFIVKCGASATGGSNSLHRTVARTSSDDVLRRRREIPSRNRSPLGSTRGLRSSAKVRRLQPRASPAVLGAVLALAACGGEDGKSSVRPSRTKAALMKETPRLQPERSRSRWRIGRTTSGIRIASLAEDATDEDLDAYTRAVREHLRGDRKASDVPANYEQRRSRRVSGPARRPSPRRRWTGEIRRVCFVA